MRNDDAWLAGWSSIVDAIIRGEPVRRSLVTLGPTPPLLQGLGLAPADLAMVPAKIARARRDHPEVQLEHWRKLPSLLGKPLAVVPSVRRDGSLLVVLVVRDSDGLPIIVPIAPGVEGHPNIVLSMYGKSGGVEWIQRQLEHAVAEALPHYVSKGFAATLPQPGSASAIPSSPGPIPADGTAKPLRNVLKLGKKSRSGQAD